VPSPPEERSHGPVALRQVVPPAEVSTKGHGESTDEEPGEGDGDDTRDVQAARLTVKLSGRAEASARRRRPAEVFAADHLRLRCTMNAATMMMKTAIKVPELMCYSKTLAAPNRLRVTDRSSDC